MANLTMADVRSKFPQYNDMSDDDLAAALHKQFYSDMPADQFAAKIGYTMPTKPSIAPNTGLAGPLGDVIEAGMGPADTVASAASHGVSGVVAPVMAAGARIYAHLMGHDPDVAASAMHHWMANNTYKAQTPTGKLVGDAATQTMGMVTKPFDIGGNAIRDAAIKLGADPVTLDKDAAAANDYIGAATTLIPGISEAMDAAKGANLANPANVAKTGAEVGEQAGYKGLQSQQDLKLPGAQQVTDKLISDDAGLPQGQQLSVSAVQGARKAGPAKVYDGAKASVPAALTQDTGLQNAISSIGDTASQLPRSPDVEGLKETMLNQPDMTKDQLFANVAQARERAANFLASEDPDKLAVGQAYHKLADAYEDFIGRQLDANPNSTVTLPQFQAARVQFAKNYAAEAALKGGEHVDPMVYARILAKDPISLTGNAAIVGKTAAALPVAPPFGVERGLVHAVGLAGGAGAAHMVGGGPAAELVSGAAASAAAPYVARFLHNMFASGDVGAAGETIANPALSYFFKNGQLPEGWNRSIVPPMPPRAPLLLGHEPGGPMVNAGGGAATPSILDELGLTQDVARAGAAHPGAATRPDEPFVPPPGQMGEVHPPLTQNWHGAGPDGVPNFSTAPGAGGGAQPDTRDFAAALSSLVPDNIMQRTASGGGRPMFEALNRTPDQLAEELRTAVGKPKKKGGASNAAQRDKDGNPPPGITDLLGAIANGTQEGPNIRRPHEKRQYP